VSELPPKYSWGTRPGIQTLLRLPGEISPDPNDEPDSAATANALDKKPVLIMALTPGHCVGDVKIERRLYRLVYQRTVEVPAVASLLLVEKIVQFAQGAISLVVPGSATKPGIAAEAEGLDIIFSERWI